VQPRLETILRHPTIRCRVVVANPQYRPEQNRAKNLVNSVVSKYGISWSNINGRFHVTSQAIQRSVMPAIYTQAATLKRNQRRSLMQAYISVMAFLLRIKFSELSAILQTLICAPPVVSTRGFPKYIERLRGGSGIE
jgi:hypothetical protein